MAIAEMAKIVAELFASADENSAKATPDFQTASHLFDYDAKTPFDIHEKIIEEFNGGTLHDITYASPKGGPIAAYLVVPKGKGPFAAALFGHWGNGTRTEFIPEAKLYARAGAVSLLPDYPWDRPQPWHKTPNHYDKPELDREIEIQAVLELRRGIDLLLARPDVDPKRLAYVGHSYGAQWGSILSAVDKRMKTSVLMAGVAEIGDIFLRGNDPGIIELRKSRPPGQFERYAQIAGEIDALHFVGHAAPIPLLFQFTNFEQLFDKTSMEHYAATATDPKKVLYYDTGHDLNDPQALQDRYDWLAKYIDLRRVPLFPIRRRKCRRAENSTPEFRRCAICRGALSLRYENINLSYCSASHRSRGGGSARSRVWRRGPRSDQSGLSNWLSMPALSALGTTWRACDSISLHFDSRRSSVF